MGLTTFKGELPTLKEAQIAKNYLTEKELQGLNQLVSGYQKYQNQTISSVERDYLREIKVLDTYVKKGGK